MGGSLQNLQFASQSVSNGNRPLPQEGPRSIPLVLDFTTATGNSSVNLDLKQAQAMAKVSYIQTLFVDNSGNADTVTFQSPGLNQFLIVPPNSQAYLPILAINPPVIIASSNGNVKVPVQLLNFPLPPAVWSVNGASFSFDNGLLEVTDVALDGLIGNWNGFGNSLAVADLGLQSLITGTAPNESLRVTGGGSGLSAANKSYANDFVIQAAVLVAGVALQNITLFGIDVTISPFMISSNSAGDSLRVILLNGTSASNLFWQTAISIPGTAPTAIPQASHLGVSAEDVNFELTTGNDLRFSCFTENGSTISGWTGGDPIHINVRYTQQ